MQSLGSFLSDALGAMFRGDRRYQLWITALSALVLVGCWQYVDQLRFGLVTTGMSDQVSWGFYIANFAFLVGVAASAVLLIIPAYVFNRKDAEEVVLLGEAMAVAAVVSAILFVIVDLGRPDRLWHMLPLLGRFNFPASMLAWDVVVLG
ncbi:polysulfide reductase, partial [Thiohalocapsa halophila]